MNNKEPTSNLAERCYQQISTLILNGELQPGSPLKMEQLKQTLNAGFSPIREALVKLCMTGLASSQSNKGFRVSHLSQAQLTDLIQSVYDLESILLRRSIRDGNTEWEAKLLASHHKFAQYTPVLKGFSLEAWYQLHHDFHNCLIAGSDSPSLLRARDNLLLQFEHYLRQFFAIAPPSAAAVTDEHKQLLDASLARNDEKACAILKKHILASSAPLVDFFNKHNLFTI